MTVAPCEAPDQGRSTRRQGARTTPFRVGRNRRAIATVAIVLATVALLSLPNVPVGSASAGPANAVGTSTADLGGALVNPGGSTASANLVLSPTGYTLSPILWGTTVTPRAHILPDEGLAVNATPTQIVVWPGASAGDYYDPFTNQIYGIGVKPVTASTSEAEFVAWCKSINCSAIIQVPGEIDNASFAAAIVNYTENTLDFHPTYWEIGNEPEVWSRWAIPWSEWMTARPSVTVTPKEYAWEVNHYIAAMRLVDPNIPVIGIPASGRPNGPYALGEWVSNTTVINGPNLSGVAVHLYPARGNYEGAATSLAAFYAALNGTGGLVDHVDVMREVVQSVAENISCPSCASIPVLVTEIGTALSHFTDQVYAQNLPGGLAMAAQAVQAIDLNLTTMDLFSAVGDTANSWMTLTGTSRPEYTIYTDILSHLGTKAFPAALQVSPSLYLTNTSLGANLFAVATTDPGDSNRADLMVLNLNTTTSVTFAPSLPGIAPGTAAESWQWAGQVSSGSSYTSVTPETPAPVAQFLPSGLPDVWTLPPQSIALFEAYPDAGAPVHFNETGLAKGTRWYVTLDGTTATGVASSNRTVGPTFFLEPGTKSVDYTTLPLPAGAKVPSQSERTQPFGPATVEVGQSAQNVSVGFANQWTLNVTATPSYGGSVDPAPSWVNASAPIELTAQPAAGYLFSHWVGYGAGSVNGGSNPQIVLRPNASIKEQAVFVQGFQVTFTESGLPQGTNWSTLVAGIPLNSSTDAITFLQRNGTFGYSAPVVDDYGAYDANSSFTVAGANVTIHLVFRLLPPFEVVFREVGLPQDTVWSVTVRGTPLTTRGSVLIFWEPNGTSGFSVSKILGYESSPGASAFTLDGGPTTITVVFSALPPPPPEYLVTFVETGLAPGTAWGVTVHGVNATTTATTLVFEEANGSYGYRAFSPLGYVAGHGNSLAVVGGPLDVPIGFSPVTYQVVWKATGLVANFSWAISLDGNLTAANGAWLTLMLTNGSYSFQVSAIPGFAPQPRHGTVRLDGEGAILEITFIRVLFPVTFAASGVPANSSWQVRLANVTGNTTGSAAGFLMANGTYTYDVSAPPGFYAVPSHGTVTVNGAAFVIPVTLHPTGASPPPALWDLAGPALGAAAAIGISLWATLALVGYLRRRDEAKLRSRSTRSDATDGGLTEAPADSRRDR